LNEGVIGLQHDAERGMLAIAIFVLRSKQIDTI